MAATIRSLLLPDWQAALDRLSPEELSHAAELRLRTGFPPTIVIDGRECVLPGAAAAESAMLETILSRAAEYSLYAVREALAEGYLTLPGGHRIGVCGTAVRSGDGVTAETRIRLTATCKGGASASNCNLFFVGDFHVRYTD